MSNIAKNATINTSNKEMYEGMMAGLNLVQATRQGLSVDVLLAIVDTATATWAQLARQATHVRLAEIISSAYGALTHERIALDSLYKLPLDPVEGIKPEDRARSLALYDDAIMYCGFASNGWSQVATDLYTYLTLSKGTEQTPFEQETHDLCRSLDLNALQQRNRLAAVIYRLSLQQARCYEQLLYPAAPPPLTEEEGTDDQQ